MNPHVGVGQIDKNIPALFFSAEDRGSSPTFAFLNE